jgi:hypothetical protein
MLAVFPTPKSCTIPGSMSATRAAAFTLLEICLVLCIGMILIMMAVPSVVGVLAEQRLHDSYERFEQFAREARTRSIDERIAYHLVWDEGSILLEPVGRPKAEKGQKDKANPGKRLAIGKDESFKVERVAALTKNPPAEWTFWPNGTCEPVIISYHGPAGRWQVKFDAMNSQGTFLESDTQ